ncbi:HIT domain-containing protein [bacterium]|nr:HIT domain-containing protein [bacterium]
MTHKQLWAPWRLAYVQSTGPSEQPAHSCFLCHYRDSDADRENLVVLRGEHSLVVLNRFPYNNGHLLIAPREHKADLRDLNDAELLESTHLLQKLTRVLEQTMTPDGFNVGLNLGRVAGAGLPGHLHWHIVPRWNGDTNFMPVLGETKVIPQSLDALYTILREALSSDTDAAGATLP